MTSAQGVISKKYHQCSQDELRQAHKELFGVAPCRKCQAGEIDWNSVYKKIVKQYNQLKQLPMSQEKLIWNPIHKGMTFFLKGRPLTVGNSTDQKTLETIFLDPKRKGIVIENPNFEGCDDCDDDHPCEECEEKKKAEAAAKANEVVETTTVDESEQKELVIKLKASGLSNNKIAKQTGISYKKIKEYLE